MSSRYDRQLRLWAADGQAALEAAHVLVLSSSATATAILKNLVLPGIGAFTILDDALVSPSDAGNNFFLHGPHSIGKPRAQQAAVLLQELNDSVRGYADLTSLDHLLAAENLQISKYTLVVAHNLPQHQLQSLSQLLWQDTNDAPPLVVVRSAGFLAEFFIQQHEHTIIESHSETAPSLRIDKPFLPLLQYSQNLDFDALDPIDHGHVPYVILLVKVMQQWKQDHDGLPPQTHAEKVAFKQAIHNLKLKSDEENFDEAQAQAYRSWTETKVPTGVAELFHDPRLETPDASSPPFFHLLSALKAFAAQPPYTLPLSSTLPDMKASTQLYITLQSLYKDQAEREKNVFKSLISPDVQISDDLIDAFVKNAHGLKIIRGSCWDSLDKNTIALGEAATASPKQLAIHLALSAASSLASKTCPEELPAFTIEALTQEAQSLLPLGTELPQEFEYTAAEIARSPTADLPNTAAFLGGLVAQEMIKMITKQYVPMTGVCTVDLIDTWTGILDV